MKIEQHENKKTLKKCSSCQNTLRITQKKEEARLKIALKKYLGLERDLDRHFLESLILAQD